MQGEDKSKCTYASVMIWMVLVAGISLWLFVPQEVDRFPSES
jgi:hypothetical protein